MTSYEDKKQRKKETKKRKKLVQQALEDEGYRSEMTGRT